MENQTNTSEEKKIVNLFKSDKGKRPCEMNTDENQLAKKRKILSDISMAT